MGLCASQLVVTFPVSHQPSMNLGQCSFESNPVVTAAAAHSWGGRSPPAQSPSGTASKGHTGVGDGIVFMSHLGLTGRALFEQEKGDCSLKGQSVCPSVCCLSNVFSCGIPETDP